MGTRSLLFGICAILLVICLSSKSQAETQSVVVGSAKCLDCSRKNIKAEHAFKGLNVAIKCKASSGEYETKTLGQLDDNGAFNIPLATELVREDGELKQECMAELHSAASTPCPGQQPSKLTILKSKDDDDHNNNGKHTFVTSTDKLPFASATCSSAFLWKWKPFHKLLKPVYKPPTPVYTPTPVYKPPVYTPTPVYKPPVYTPTPVYKPTTPYYKPPFYHPHPGFKFPPYTPHPWKKFFKKKHPFWPPAAKKEGRKH